jgi:hypothetical protein
MSMTNPSRIIFGQIFMHFTTNLPNLKIQFIVLHASMYDFIPSDTMAV